VPEVAVDGVDVEPLAVPVPIVVGVLKNQDPVAQTEFEALGPFGVGEVLGHPQSAAPIPRHGDGVADFRLGGKNSDQKPVRHLHFRSRLFGGWGSAAGFGFAVERFGELAAGDRRSKKREKRSFRLAD